MKLSPIQEEIVETSGNLIVRASAGTGKTFTMVNKIAKEIDKKYENEEQKDLVKIDYERINKLGTELIEDDLIVIEDNTLRHNSMKLSSLIFSYLMR